MDPFRFICVMFVFVMLSTPCSLVITRRERADLLCVMFSCISVTFPSGVVLFYEPRHEISNNVVWATSKAPDQPAHKCSLIRAFASRLNIL